MKPQPKQAKQKTNNNSSNSNNNNSIKVSNDSNKLLTAAQSITERRGRSSLSSSFVSPAVRAISTLQKQQQQQNMNQYSKLMKQQQCKERFFKTNSARCGSIPSARSNYNINNNNNNNNSSSIRTGKEVLTSRITADDSFRALSSIQESIEDPTDPLNIRHLMTETNRNRSNSNNNNNNNNQQQQLKQKPSPPIVSPRQIKTHSARTPIQATQKIQPLASFPPASSSSSSSYNNNNNNINNYYNFNNTFRDSGRSGGKETLQQRVERMGIQKRDQRRRELYAWNEELRLKHQSTGAVDAV